MIVDRTIQDFSYVLKGKSRIAFVPEGRPNKKREETVHVQSGGLTFKPCLFLHSVLGSE